MAASQDQNQSNVRESVDKFYNNRAKNFVDAKNAVSEKMGSVKDSIKETLKSSFRSKTPEEKAAKRRTSLKKTAKSLRAERKTEIEKMQGNAENFSDIMHIDKMNSGQSTKGITNFSKVQDRSAMASRDTGIGKTLSGMSSFSLTTREFISPRFTTRDAAARAISHINPVGAGVRSDMLNMMGVLTKAQKVNEKVRKSNMTSLTIKGFAAYTAYEAMGDDNENLFTSMLGTSMDISATMGGMAAGRAVGGTIGTAIDRGMAYKSGKISLSKATKKQPSPISSKNLRRATRFTGATLGAVGGAGLAMGVLAISGLSEGLSHLTKSDNVITSHSDSKLYTAMYGQMKNTEETYTMRQKALSKMSRSGLNDRALMLGNEAIVMRGMM